MLSTVYCLLSTVYSLLSTVSRGEGQLGKCLHLLAKGGVGHKGSH